MRRTYALLSRLDVEQYLVELPPMAEDAVGAALRFRLGSLYPGDCETARIDRARNGRRGKGYVLFVADESTLAAYRSEAKGKALLSSTLVAAELAPRGPWSCLVWAGAWASLDRFEDGKALECRRVLRGADPGGDLRRLLEGPSDDASDAAIVGFHGARMGAFTADDAAGEGAALEAALVDLGMREPRVLPFAAALSRACVSRAALFPLRPRARKRRAYLLAALACLDIALLGFLAAFRLASLEAELSAVKEAYLRMQRRNGEALRILEEIPALEKRYEKLAAESVPDMYAVVASVAANSGSGSSILSLVVKDGSFRMEAEGPDALASLSALERSGCFSAVKLHESRPVTGGKERFSISGSAASVGRGLPR